MYHSELLVSPRLSRDDFSVNIENAHDLRYNKRNKLDSNGETIVKRGILMSDTHCGHLVGLTTPDFQPHFKRGSLKQKTEYSRGVYWDWFAEEIEKLRPFDFLIFNGDAIDGKGEASGGTEQLEPDRRVQVKMAIDIVKFVNAPSMVFSFGTAYHTGREEDWESQLADEFHADITSHDARNVNGLLIDFKHHISGSQSPMGGASSLTRENVWNILWAEHGEYPRADLLIRSHTHRHVYTGGYGWLAMVLPGLQGYGSKFGTRRMSGTVDYGFVSIDIEDKRNYSWQSHILKQKSNRQVKSL